MIAEKLAPSFKIFVEEVNGIKKLIVEKPVVEELVQTEEPKENIPPVKLKNTIDQEKECDFTTFVLNGILDIFYNDFDIYVANLFDTVNLFFSKVNTIKSDFAYLCDVLTNGYSVYDDNSMHMFDINSV